MKPRTSNYVSMDAVIVVLRCGSRTWLGLWVLSLLGFLQLSHHDSRALPFGKSHSFAPQSCHYIFLAENSAEEMLRTAPWSMWHPPSRTAMSPAVAARSPMPKANETVSLGCIMFVEVMLAALPTPLKRPRREILAWFGGSSRQAVSDVR